MTALTMNLFYHTKHGPNGELKDWYYHFKGNSGDDFVIHELSHTDMKQKITKKQNIMSAGQFFVELKHPKLAKDKLQNEIDKVTVNYIRPF